MALTATTGMFFKRCDVHTGRDSSVLQSKPHLRNLEQLVFVWKGHDSSFNSHSHAYVGEDNLQCTAVVPGGEMTSHGLYSYLGSREYAHNPSPALDLQVIVNK